MEVPTGNMACAREDVAAWLDGELTGAAQERFETHVAQCSQCADELRSQRQLLCTLEAAFGSASKISLPENFTRVVAAHAENDVHGLRRRSERRRAFQLCALLAVGAFALLGAASGPWLFQPARSSFRIASRAFEVFSQSLLDAAEGIAIVGRMIGRAAVSSPFGLGGAVLVLIFVGAASLLPRLIANYHRAQIIE